LKILIVDNYDSFTYNLYHYVKQFNDSVEVIKNDELNLSDISLFEKIILSPGPGLPKEHKYLKEIIQLSLNKSLLGVCLGHQAIYEHFGGDLSNLEDVNHGVSTKISIIDNDYIFKDINKQINVGLYHSWVVNKDNLPRCLEITSINEDGFISSFKHKELDVRGVQFHPESILTDNGLKMIENWVRFN
jgi:anthranilate synthase component 2